MADPADLKLPHVDEKALRLLGHSALIDAQQCAKDETYSNRSTRVAELIEIADSAFIAAAHIESYSARFVGAIVAGMILGTAITALGVWIF